jgi:hypothetical protein
MTLQELGSLGEFIGALAVIASLAYVALQIRQHTRSLRTASFQALMQSAACENRIIAQDPAVAELYLRGLDSYDELDSVEKSRFSALMYNFIWLFEITLSLHREGVSTDSRLEAQLAGVLEQLDHPGAAKWWEHAGIDATVRAFIDARREASR